MQTAEHNENVSLFWVGALDLVHIFDSNCVMAPLHSFILVDVEYCLLELQVDPLVVHAVILAPFNPALGNHLSLFLRSHIHLFD